MVLLPRTWQLPTLSRPCLGAISSMFCASASRRTPIIAVDAWEKSAGVRLSYVWMLLPHCNLINGICILNKYRRSPNTISRASQYPIDHVTREKPLCIHSRAVESSFPLGGAGASCMTRAVLRSRVRMPSIRSTNHNIVENQKEQGAEERGWHLVTEADLAQTKTMRTKKEIFGISFVLMRRELMA